MKLKFCGCRACKAGRSKPRNRTIINKAKRAAKRRARVDVSMGREPDRFVSIPYTD